MAIFVNREAGVEPPGSFSSIRGTLYIPVSLALFVAGSVIQLIAYRSMEPLLTGIIFLLLGALVLVLTPAGGRYEGRAFLLTFSTCWFWAGIAAVFANFLGDYSQNYQDAAEFHELVISGSTDQMSLQEIALMTTGAGAVVIWRTIYDLFAAIGFEKGRFIGIAVNVLLVSFTAVAGVKMVRQIFGNDRERLWRFTLIFALCGLFWLFAALHLRDALGLFGITVLALVWVRYTVKPTLANICWVTAATFLGFTFFGFVRAQFLFVPLAMLGAGMGALLFRAGVNRRRLLAILVPIIAGLAVFAFLISQFQSDVLAFLIRGNTQYKEFAGAASGSDSLGMTLIVGAPLPLRLILGSAYLFVFPIPVWSGFQLETAYHLLKSFQALFMYAVTPLLILSMRRILFIKSLRSPALMFLVFLTIGFTLSIAGTSLETRHFGAFLVPMLVLAVLPDLSQPAVRLEYRRLFLSFIGMMAIVHIVWLAAKLP